MIITFTGTEKGSNSLQKAAAITAGLLSLSNNQKVLVIQLMNEKTGIEELFRGKEYDKNTIAALQNAGIDETGLDGLLRKVNTVKLSADQFKVAAKGMLNSENRLDILPSSKIANFYNTLSIEKIDAIQRIIKYANDPKCYDYVLVTLPHNAAEMKDKYHYFLEMADVNVSCVRQGNHEDPFLNGNSGCKNVFLVTHFDPESMYNLKIIKKAYAEDDGKAKVFAMPHNTQFKDVCMDRSLFRWLCKNYSPSVEDINYTFIQKMQQLTNYISDTEEVEIPEPDVKRRQKPVKEKNKKRTLEEAHAGLGDLDDVEVPVAEDKINLEDVATPTPEDKIEM